MTLTGPKNPHGLPMPPAGVTLGGHRCTCRCHSTPGIVHIMACCYPAPVLASNPLQDQIAACEKEFDSWPEWKQKAMRAFMQIELAPPQVPTPATTELPQVDETVVLSMLGPVPKSLLKCIVCGGDIRECSCGKGPEHAP